MNLNRNKITSKNKQYYLESVKQAKQYVKQGKLSTEDLQTLIKISPEPKYVGWLAKVWINEKPDIDDLRNYIEEYDTFAKKGKAKYFRYFNSTIVADFIINKTFGINKKYFWEN